MDHTNRKTSEPYASAAHPDTIGHGAYGGGTELVATLTSERPRSDTDRCCARSASIRASAAFPPAPPVEYVIAPGETTALAAAGA